MGKAVFVLHGVYFFLKNPTLWRAALCPLLTTVIFSIIITAIFFAKVFGAQIALFSGYVVTWLAVIMSLFLTLVEILLCIYVFASVILQYYRTRLENRVYELNGKIDERSALHFLSSSLLL
jgi:hypothetical protein